ncbi:pyridoxal-phosphate-dependent aminotransferase family protein [Jiangella alkaliphila]|uniref:(S)-ureidoglycine-glyoxylate aminotransferase n=1 Tax=Jiangella alkaliphila TaxID=419479 RepID=A0A1H2LC58_9ACTN|nr:alanine--glyoxylate aminotransferase family protein [Jiangella alkaliphila]SDU78607.1 (S)-ureidoglycine-glyoxylate aminotransferase [Jiangella alkaliphila]
MPYDQIAPPARLLMGPGPISADPRVLRAMSAQLVGQFDPAMTAYMGETMELFRAVFRTGNEQTFLVDGTARAAIEAALVSLCEPGDRVVVPVFGRFGQLLVEIAERVGAEVHQVQAPWGEIVPPERIEEVVARVQPVVVAVAHGDTSTTMCQPLQPLGEICARHGALFYADVTASLGGNPFEMDDWGVDVASAGLQKCLGGPPGSAPISLSGSAVRRVEGRRHVELGLRTDQDVPRGRRIASAYFDLAMIMDYWGKRGLNHHTEATTMLYGARECARLVVAEGIDAAIGRHRLHGAAMLAGVGGLGLETFGDAEHRMNNVVAVRIPDGVDGESVRRAMLADFGIEIGTSFGPLHGVVWRIGTMGYNARTDAVLTTLVALEAVLRVAGVAVVAGGGFGAAREVYDDAFAGSLS